MPNWCSTYLRVKGTEGELKTVEEEITKAMTKEFTKTDFGKNWLGNLLYSIGLKETIDAKEGIRCRGTVDDFEMKDGEFHIWTTSAWCPHVKCVEKFVHHFAPETELYYTAEEPGVSHERPTVH